MTYETPLAVGRGGAGLTHTFTGLWMGGKRQGGRLDRDPTWGKVTPI